MFKNLVSIVLVTLLAAGLSACSNDAETEVNLDPVAFHSGDECHVCGMIISEWPGPKGEVLEAKSGQIHKFCSTTDMFSWVLQPENQRLKTAIYVHDMSQSHWDKPDDEHLIDARTAYYVTGSKKMGMGPTLATFASQQAAQEFAQKEGGKVLAFAEINESVLREIAMQAHEHIQQHNEQIQQDVHGHHAHH